MAAIDVTIPNRPTVEITHPNVVIGGLVTEQINGVTIGTSASGSTNNQLIKNSGGTPVGTAANPSVVSDATVENTNSSYSVNIEAEGNLVIPNTPISANGDLIINQPSTIAKDVVVRYETQGVAPTTIVSGEVVVPDSFVPDPNRNPFTGNYSALAGSFGTGYQADGYGCFKQLYRWTTEPATSQDCTVEYYCGVLFGNQTFIGFSEVLTSLPVIGNGFTGIFNNGSSLGYFYVNDVLAGTFYNPSTLDDVIEVTWNKTDGKFRLYVAGVLTYTSTYTKFGSVYPFAGANAGLQPVAGCFVTRLD